MSLTASMWSGVSGLLVHGEKMNVIGHNIANVNTIGFKSQRMDFQDLFYNNTFSSAGLEQVGMGARVGTVLTDFSQGPFEQTGLSTDLAISGKGWFQVRVPNQDTLYYTRAGDFSFNNKGELKNPQGYILQGWKVPIDQGPSVGMGISPQSTISSPIIGTGVPTDIKLDTWTVLPKETSKIQTYVQLSSLSTDHSHWDSNPFAALFNTWDGQLVDPVTKQPIQRNNRPYLAEDAFAYQSPIKIYDDAGVAHTATIYFDKVEKDFSTLGTTYYDGGKPSQTIWEYVVTIDPAEDARMYWEAGSTAPRSIQETKMAGILMTGTMTFGSNGDLVNQTAYTLMGGLEAVQVDAATGNGTLQNGYVGVWTDPANPANKVTFQPGATIPATQMKDTAFYPVINTTQTAPAAVADAINTNVPVASTLAAAAVAVGGPPPTQYTVNAGYTITVPAPTGSGTVYNGGDVIANPADLAALNVGGATADSYTRRLATVVKSGYQIVGSDTLTYSGGAILPAGVTASSAVQVLGAQNELMSWYPTSVSNNGLPLMVADFTGVEQAYTVGSPLGKEHLIEMDFGLKLPNLTNPWVNNLPLGTSRSAGGSFADNSGAIDPNNPATWASASGLAGVNGTPVLVAEHTKLTGAASSSTTLSQQNGYTFGNLMDVTFDQYGVMSGIYSNGVTLPLYQIVLYDFVAPQGLRFEGGNLVSQTRESGDPSWGAAGTAGFGTINGYMIEQSNVDLAKEMVQMITTQRGFQSNSKVITTTDVMLETVVNMKR